MRTKTGEQKKKHGSGCGHTNEAGGMISVAEQTKLRLSAGNANNSPEFSGYSALRKWLHRQSPGGQILHLTIFKVQFYNMAGIIIRQVASDEELQGIHALQAANLQRNINAAEAAAEGFVTAEYSVALLRQMHREHPSIIAKDGDLVAGYALVTLPSICNQHPLLADLVNTINGITYKSVPLRHARYVVVGQLCVAKAYRGRGLVQQLYEAFREALHQQFDYCITDVADNNPRSLKAHVKTGFEIIDTLQYGGLRWHIVLWDWKANAVIAPE